MHAALATFIFSSTYMHIDEILFSFFLPATYTMAMMFKLGLLAMGAGVAVSQFISPPTDLITATGYAGYQVRCRYFEIWIPIHVASSDT